MEQFEEYGVDPSSAHGLAVDDAHESHDSHDSQEALDSHSSEHEEHVEESVYTDDPVRVYLREMGSVRLLTRQGEIDLARRMERGKLKMRKAISRSPLVWQAVFALFEDIRKSDLPLDGYIELGSQDDEIREEMRADV